MATSSRAAQPFWIHPYFAASLAAVGAIVSAWLLRTPPSAPALRIAFAMLPVPPSMLLIYSMSRWTRNLDEMQSRMQAEALALAFAGALLLTLVVQALQKAGYASSMNWDFVWSALMGLYVGARFLVCRRYA
jgi:hypothetical protein